MKSVNFADRTCSACCFPCPGNGAAHCALEKSFNLPTPDFHATYDAIRAPKFIGVLHEETSMEKSTQQAKQQKEIPPQEIDAKDQADYMNNVRQSALRGMAPSTGGAPTEMLEDEPNEQGPDELGNKESS
jgi:hypothetical protein